MNPSRRQRYFRTSSPEQRPLVRSLAVARTMNNPNMNVLEQAELVMDGGDNAFPGDDQQVAHEEIVDDGSSEMVVEHHHHPQMRQMHHHYEDHHRQPTTTTTVYQVAQQGSQPPRRAVGRTLVQQQRPATAYGQNQMDMVQKLQNKSIYMPPQRPQTRISPTGARIVSFSGGSRKREAADGLPLGVKKIQRGNAGLQQQQHSGLSVMQAQQQQHQHQQPSHQMQNHQQSAHQSSSKNLQPVKVVRLAPSSIRSNPTIAEHALIEIEANIKQTIEDGKVDMERIKDLQEAELSQEEYHQMMGILLVELERVNAANTSLNQFYRERQRHEKTVAEAREDAFAARIRQLETENRKLRDGLLMVHMARFNEAGGHNPYRADHMGQMLVEEPEDHVVIEEHVGQKSDYPETEEVPAEWIVEETVDHRMHMQSMEPDDLQHQQQQQQQQEQDEHDDGRKDKNNIMGGGDDDQFVTGDDRNGQEQ